MNKVILMGRLTRDPEVREGNGMKVAKYGLAVNRPKNKNGEQEADFLNCVAFGKTAEFVERFLTKGRQIAIVGQLRTGNYTDKDGKKVYTTDIVVNEHYFTDSGKDAVKKSESSDLDGFSIMDNHEDLPF